MDNDSDNDFNIFFSEIPNFSASSYLSATTSNLDLASTNNKAIVSF